MNAYIEWHWSDKAIVEWIFPRSSPVTQYMIAPHPVDEETPSRYRMFKWIERGYACKVRVTKQQMENALAAIRAERERREFQA